jgi:hypothetical protein
VRGVRSEECRDGGGGGDEWIKQRIGKNMERSERELNPKGFRLGCKMACKCLKAGRSMMKM